MARKHAGAVLPGKHRARRRLLRAKARQSGVDCKRGVHRWGPEQAIGGGIVRFVCDACRTVSIDLRGATDPVTHLPSLERTDWPGPDPEPWTWGVRRTR